MSDTDVNVGEELPWVFVVTDDDGSTPKDISAGSNFVARLRAPGQDTVAKSVSFNTDGTDGALKWEPDNDTDPVDYDGSWEVQVTYTLAGDDRVTDPGRVLVGRKI